MKTVALELQPCCGKRSGIGTYTYEIARRLKDDDELHFCGNLFNFCGRNDNSEALKGIEMPMIERRIFPYGVYRRIWNCLPLGYESFFPTNADLSIFFNYIVPPRIHGKTITTIHDMTYLRFPETVDKSNLRRIERGIKYSIERSNRILTLTEFSKREIIDFLGVPAEKIELIPCAASVSDDYADFSETAAKYNIEKPYIFYVGTIEPRKNLPRLIEAFGLVKEKYHIPHRLVIAGGKGWQEDAFYDAIEKCPAKEDIQLIGYIYTPEKNTLYKNAAAFLFPSLYEGFGIPPLEAMYHNCPVVASNAASLPEVCGEAAAYVDPLDAESIAGGIWKVVSDEAFAQDMRKKGIEREKLFTWESSVEKLKSICKEVLNE